MNNKLYVGNLSYQTTESQLLEHFSQAGRVLSARIITDRDTGLSRGFGFVEMESSEAAQQAITLLNGQPLEGNPLRVDMARPQRDDQRRGTQRRGGPGRRRRY